MSQINHLFDKTVNLIDINFTKINKKNILITGAAGTVGSHLAVSLCQVNSGVNNILLLDHNDSSLNYLYQQVKIYNRCIPILGDCSNSILLRSIISKYQIDIVVHCAAYKIVPLVNLNPEVSFFNNTTASNNLFEICGEMNVQEVVFVSSYEAYNAVNVFGYTKKIAEMQMLQCSRKYKNTKFNAFRFGFIINSSGSVSQIFEYQAQNNIDLTLTHDDIERYMCTTNDVVEKIFFLFGVEKSGDIYTLDMGAPVKIRNIAQYYIDKFNSKSNIIITKLRPGDKILESPLGAESGLFLTQYKSLFINGRENINWNKLKKSLDKINDLYNSNCENFEREIKNLCDNYMK